LQADKTVTLNEREELRQREEITARQKARDKEYAARKAPDENIYDITVENAGQPGLPPPEALTTTNGVTDNFDSNSTNDFGTNAAIITTSSKAGVEKETSPFSFMPQKTLPTDPTLNETEHILESYISLLSAGHTLIAK